jgi:glycosyltransferase involved in cell wall biosynthesis
LIRYHNDSLKKKPLVSVIIPVFNRSTLVREAVDSVLNQTFNDFELIVVDDGSTDGIHTVLQRYGDKLIYIKQDNKGVSAARNRGIAQAKGEFLAFLDSDDLWMPEKLSVQVEFFRKNQEYMICQTEEIWIRNGKRVNPKKRHKKPSGMIFEPSLSLCLVSPSAVMIKKELFQEVGLFDETFPACEDYDLWLRISYKHFVYLIDRPLIVKRGGHDDQLSKSPALDKYRIQSIKKLIESNVLAEDQLAAAKDKLVEKCMIFSNGCIKRNRRDEAVYYQELAESYQ